MNTGLPTSAYVIHNLISNIELNQLASDEEGQY